MKVSDIHTTSHETYRLLTRTDHLLQNNEFPPSWSQILQDTPLTEEQIARALLELTTQQLEQDEFASLCDAYEYLLHCSLLELLVHLRHGRRAALNAWANIQTTLTKNLTLKKTNEDLVSIVLDQISALNLPVNTATLDAILTWQETRYEDEYESNDQSSEAETSDKLIPYIETLNINSELDLYELFADRLTFSPTEAINSFIFELLNTQQKTLKEGALLFLLHKNKTVRLAVLNALQDHSNQKNISPTGLRRLITSRNWLPESERKSLDKTIRTLRRNGLNCESTSAPEHIKLIQINTSTTDGAGACSVMSIFKIGTKFTLVGAIFKEGFGVLDTWISPLTTRIECENQIKHMKQEVYCLETADTWIRQALPHYLSLNVNSGEPIAAETLVWTEWLGLNIWQPQALNLKQLLQHWQDESPQSFTETQREKALKNSALWINNTQFAQGWFEQDDKLEQRINKLFAGTLSESETSITHYLLAPYTQQWYERFILLALWAKSNTRKRGPKWHDFALIASCIENHIDLGTIPIMQEIAHNTLAFYDKKLINEHVPQVAQIQVANYPPLSLIHDADRIKKPD